MKKSVLCSSMAAVCSVTILLLAVVRSHGVEVVPKPSTVIQDAEVKKGDVYIKDPVPQRKIIQKTFTNPQHPLFFFRMFLGSEKNIQKLNAAKRHYKGGKIPAYVDIHADINTAQNLEALVESATTITARGMIVQTTANAYPLKCEGNLERPAGPPGIPGPPGPPPKEFHWEALVKEAVCKVKIISPSAGEMFFIDSMPKMPKIDFVADTDPAGQAPPGASIKWKIEIIYADHSLAAQGAIDTLTVTGTSAPGVKFKPNFNKKIIGDTGETSPGGTVSECRAIATLQIAGEDCCSDEIKFHVRGENPAAAELDKALASVTGKAREYPQGMRAVTMSAAIVQAVAQKESGKKQFRGDGAPVLGVSQDTYWAKRGDRGIFQINAQWDNITTYAWNWKENVAFGRWLLEDAIRQSIQHVFGERDTHPTLPEISDKQHLQNALSIFNSGTYYWSPNTTYDGWIPNPDNPKGRAYADAILP